MQNSRAAPSTLHVSLIWLEVREDGKMGDYKKGLTFKLEKLVKGLQILDEKQSRILLA